MVSSNWFITGYSEHACKEAYHIVLTTDTICHLWLRWSSNPPQTHPRARIFRGLQVMGDVYYCFTAYHDIEQEEDGDSLTHTFTMSNWQASPHDETLLDLSFCSHPPYWEPWGATLTENNPWAQAFPADPITYSLTDGILTLSSPAGTKSGIKALTPWRTPIPLVEDGKPLYFSAKSQEAIITNPDDYTAIHVWLTFELDQVIIEFIINRGDAFGPWPRPDWIIGENYFMDYGLTPTPVNILDLFQAVRHSQGKSTDPTGWECFIVYDLLEHTTDPTSMNHVIDYINLFRCAPTTIKGESMTRWFYFHGEVGGIASPSTSCIFGRQLYYTEHDYFTRISHANDECQYSSPSLLACPDFCPNGLAVGRSTNMTIKLGAGIRFRNFRVPRCADILSAFFHFTCNWTKFGTWVNCQISAENTSTPDDWGGADVPEFLVRWNTRIGVVDWDNIPGWTAGEVYPSPNVKDTLQALVNRPDWLLGNNASFFWDDVLWRTDWVALAIRRCYSYHQTSVDCPCLYVNYRRWQVKEIVK